MHKPYLYVFYDGHRNDLIIFFENTADNLFKKILTSRYKGYTIYAHNLSRFDVVFLFQSIAKLSQEGFDVDVVKKDDKIISIKISNTDKNVLITLKDSYLILPLSLANLAKQFNLPQGKTVEPVFVGTGHDEYKSTDLTHYTKEVREEFIFRKWKKDIEEYCIQYCMVLCSVIEKFQDLIFAKIRNRHS